MRKLSRPTLLTPLLRALCLLLTFGTSSLTAEVPRVEDPKKQGILVLQHVLPSPVVPERASLLIQDSSGLVRTYRAQVVPLEFQESELKSSPHIFVAAAVPDSLLPADNLPLYGTFLLFNEYSDFLATPVQIFERSDALRKTPSLTVLGVQQEEFERKLKVKQIESESLEEQLVELRNTASRIAGVDEIVQLNAELERLKSFGEESVQELERLRRLTEIGRAQVAPAGAIQLRHVLSEQVRVAAQVTATADRLTARKREAALGSMKQKLRLIELTSTLDPEALTKEALRLRSYRRQLEHRLGTPPGEEDARP